MLEKITAGTTVLSATGDVYTVDEATAAAYQPGDLLVANPQAGLLRIPATERRITDEAVTACAAAFDQMDAVSDAQIVDFFHKFATALADDDVWAQIQRINDADVASAKKRGRSTTRLAVSEAMRANMIEGLNGWATTPTRRDQVMETVLWGETGVRFPLPFVRKCCLQRAQRPGIRSRTACRETCRSECGPR